MRVDNRKQTVFFKRLGALVLAACLMLTTVLAEGVSGVLAAPDDPDAGTICGIPAHTHSADCYETQTVLTCTLAEDETHTHTDACYETQQVLTCTLAEHSHDESCYPQAEDSTDAGDDTADGTSADETVEEPDTPAETNADAPYTMEVTFDGQKLTESTAVTASEESGAEDETAEPVDETEDTQADGNVIAKTWAVNTSKTMTVTLNRNSDVTVDPSASYLLCMKVSDLFYFTGLPDCSDINGAEQAVMVQNEVPQVNKTGGSTGNFDGFSPYSGEIRVLLNPSVNTITFSGIDVNFNPRLTGYSSGTVTVKDPIQVSFVRVDSGSDLSTLADDEKTELHRYEVNEVTLQTGTFGGGLRNGISTNGFLTDGLNEQNLALSQTDSKLSYSCSTTGQSWQVFKTLTAVYHCPYITVDGKNYYLHFDLKDTALTANKQGNKTGYRMAANAVYNEDDHTITYTFKNIYLGGHTPLFYTPVFTWPTAAEAPDEIVNLKILGTTTYKVGGSNWEVTEQTCNTDAKGTLSAALTPGNYAYYVASVPNIVMVSSDEAASSQRIAKREIYQGITRASNVPGVLGFFDIHNDGAVDSPLLNIRFDFNTDESSAASYYVTQVRLPVYGNTSGVDVTYILVNSDNETQSGTRHYDSTASFNCNVAELRSNCGVDSTYYIQSLSYQTQLQKGTKYHIETAHLNRNRPADCGLFWGYIEPKDSDAESALGMTARAVMTITSADGASAINADGKPSISSTETSTISDKDYVAFGLKPTTLNGNNTLSVTAGNTATLKFSAQISSEEYAYPNTTSVNGYHTLRDGIFYVCLPDGVSIPGKEQVTVTVGSTKPISVDSVTKLDGTACTVNGVNATWWAISAPSVNAIGDQVITVEVQLATSSTMNGLSWNFQYCVGVRADGQALSWGAASSNTDLFQSTARLATASNSAAKSLGTYLNGQNIAADKFGLEMYIDSASGATLTIVRAEAKLDVATDLHVGDTVTTSTTLQLPSADSAVHYDVTVASTDGGHAEDFNYYIPIVSTNSVVDASAMVVKKEFSLALQKAVEVTDKTVNGAAESNPFQVLYTTDSDLTSASIQDKTVNWKLADAMSDDDFKQVTAVRITTSNTTDVAVKNGETFGFHLTLGFSGSNFNELAGCVAEWRSFGRYTYVREDGASTTNTYPSGSNSLTIRYDCDMTQDPAQIGTLQINTANSKNTVATDMQFPTSFLKAQTLTIKSVKANNVTLISTDPIDLTGANANQQFKVNFNINNIGAIALSSGNNSGNWTTTANEKATLQAAVAFSPYLTETATERYVDITLGNDVVNIIWRVKLVRTVAAAQATGSGVTMGAHYLVPNVDDSCTITQNSAFTALFVVSSFNATNYPKRFLTWTDGNDTAANFPAGTAITLMEVETNSEDNSSKVTSYWSYTADGGTGPVDLGLFTRMGGTDKFSYLSSGASEDFNYLVVVDFANADAAVGNYQIGFDADSGENVATSFKPVTFPVTLTAKSTYALANASGTASLTPTVTAAYTVTRSTGDDNYREGKSLALVLGSEGLPADAQITMNGITYSRNSKGNFLLPLTVSDSATNTVSLTLVSKMFPDAETNYSLSGQLYLVGSGKATAPMAGDKVGDEATVTFSKAEKVTPAMKITGVRVGSVSSWSSGQDFDLKMDLPDGAAVTVTAYSANNQKVTDLLSSVGGVFQIENGSGTYDASKTSTGKLVLSSAAKAGTYRLDFAVKVGGSTVLTVPYYIVVY